ncbi:MAG: restriction endonuclease [bacterium]|nr:restriction endonuclease [bacterium]
MKQVFISYSFRDDRVKALARFLHEHLPSFGAGLANVYTNESIEPGEDWHDATTDAIDRCSILVCFANKENPNVMFELGYALGKNKPIILIGDSDSIPDDLHRMTCLSPELHPFDVLAEIEKHLLSQEERKPYLGLDPNAPRHNLETLKGSPDLIDSLDPREFEELIKHWFLNKGFRVRPQDETRDFGYDFAIHPFRCGYAAVEVKKYKTTSKVPVSIVRQLVGALVVEQIPVGIIVSSAPFTESARYFAEEIEPKVLLWTLDDLLDMNELPNNRMEFTGDPLRGSPETQR